MATNEASAHVIYHADCVDGFTSAHIARICMPNANFHAARYGDRLSLLPARGDVYILDFSYPRVDMEWASHLVHARGDKFVCLDHHITAQAALADIPGCHFDVTKSGALLTWEHFFTEAPPVLVQRVSDNDTGARKMPYAAEFNALIGSYPFDFVAYTNLYRRVESSRTTEGLVRLVEAGTDILREVNKRADLVAVQAHEVILGGHDAKVVNCADRALFTKIGMLLASRCEGGVGACFYVRSDLMVEWSIRSLRPEQATQLGLPCVDVSQLAKTYGGGGHPHAAGFVCSISELAVILGSAQPALMPGN